MPKTLLKTETKPEDIFTRRPPPALERSVVITESEVRDLNELSLAIHGFHQLLQSSREIEEPLDAANLLLPIDNQLYDLVNKIEHRLKEEGGS